MLLALLALFFGSPPPPPGRTVALTFDDLPAVGVETKRDAEQLNRVLMKALRRYRAPATVFVNEKTVERLQARSILEEWRRNGHALGNHTYSHPDLNDLTPAQFAVELKRGEASLGFDRQAGPRYLRFPFNHAGDTVEKQAAVAAILREHHYEVATCTIDTSDYQFAQVYDLMLARHDQKAMDRLKAEYLTFTATEIDYYAGLQRQIFGRETPQVMLLHANRLNAEVLPDILAIFAQKQYAFVTLPQAQSDAVYRTPLDAATKFGPMWGYRWARQLGVKVDGRLEAEPPAWITAYH